MDPFVGALILAWVIGRYTRDSIAAARGGASARAEDRAARQDPAAQAAHERRQAHLGPTIWQAIAARIADWILSPEQRQARRDAKRQRRAEKPPPAMWLVLTNWWADVCEEADYRREQRRMERLNRRREREGLPIIDVEVEEPAVAPKFWCAHCAVREVNAPGGRCPACADNTAEPVNEQPTLTSWPCRRLCGRTNPYPDTVCAHCVVAERTAETTDDGWQETTAGAEVDGGDHNEQQDGDAYYRRWVQPHPSGDGTLRTTITSYAVDDGQRRWIVTETEWQWIGDNPHDPLFEEVDESDSYRDGPSGEPWPTPDDVRRDVDDIHDPPAANETPLADVLDATVCPGCGTWSVGEGMCDVCADDRALGAANDTPETPEPDPTPEQHHEGDPPMSQPLDIDGDAKDPTGSLRFSRACDQFCLGVSGQYETLANCAEAGGAGPAIHGEIRNLSAAFAAAAADGAALGEIFEQHVTKQNALGANSDLSRAIRGYLDSRHTIS